MEAGGIAGERLKSIVERVERINEELKALNEDKTEIFAEAKGCGLDPKIIKIIIKRRRMSQYELELEDSLVDLYQRAIANASVGESETEDQDASRARARETGDAAVQRAIRKFVHDVPNDTTVSIATPDGKGFAVTNADGVRTVRQFGEDQAPVP